MESIAIVGIGCRFPGANSPEDLWELLRQGRFVVSTVPHDRWDIDSLYSPDPAVPGKMNSRYGAFLEQITDFDAEFFGISPREARHLDPQQRLLLEVVWEAFQDGGFPVLRLPGERTGVYVGIMGSDHTHRALGDLFDMNAHTGSGIGYCLTANRISYQFNFGGPSMAIDTACSSSLVATHLACQSLRSGETDVAVAAGVNIILSPALNVFYTKTGLLSPDGACKTFDAAANGIVRGEGAGAVVLKRLGDALADKDRIYAVIRGSAVNQDGRSNGITAPNRWAQERVLRAAYQQAKVSPASVKYIELHGTGTLLGDPIEAQALASVLAPGRQKPCAVGSIKTNMGHLEGAAGIAGLIKVALMMRHRHFVPSLHYTKLNSHIAAAKVPLYIQTKAMPFTEIEESFVAGVSSFGLGGTNAHVVLEAPPVTTDACEVIPGNNGQVLQLSAPTRDGLKALAGRYATFLDGKDNQGLRDICFTTNSTRDQFSHRIVINVQEATATANTLRDFAEGERNIRIKDSAQYVRKVPKIGFMFTGQGAQYSRMAEMLYQHAPIFRDSLNECASIVDRTLPRPLLSVMFESGSDDTTINQTRYSQPALFAVEYALTRLLASWGVEPNLVMGHSVGEYVAACVAGAYTLEDGLLLIDERARLMSELSVKGGMAVVFASEECVLPFVQESGGAVVIAALNGPENTVISGEIHVLEIVQERLTHAGHRCVKLDVSIPFHSPHIKPMTTEFEGRIARLNMRPLSKSLVSNLTGRILTLQELSSPSYWSRHACEPVQFVAGVQVMQESGCNILVEVGPKAVLTAMASHFVDPSVTTIVPTLRADRNDLKNLADCIGSLYVLGVDVDWAAYESVLGGRKTSVPTYPFQRKRHWKQYSLSKLSEQSNNQNGVDKAVANHVEDTPTQPRCAPTNMLETIRQVVAAVGQTTLATVVPDSRLCNDLGFDSLMLVELRNKIANLFPEAKDIPIAKFFAGASVADIVTHLEANRGGTTLLDQISHSSAPNPNRSFKASEVIASWAANSAAMPIVRIDRNIVHKMQTENVLLSRLEQVEPDIVIGEVVQDIDHSFFYEHEKDHVPGLYLIEAARQFGIALAHLYYDVPHDCPFIMDDLRVRFFKFAETTRPLFIIGQILEKTHHNGNLTHMRSSATFMQDGSDICTVEGNFLITDPSWYAKKRNLKSAQAEFAQETV
jgi:acyl transferase domain-containing protein